MLKLNFYKFSPNYAGGTSYWNDPNKVLYQVLFVDQFLQLTVHRVQCICILDGFLFPRLSR